MTISSRARILAILIAVGLTMAARAPVHAQTSEPTAADLESARALYREGKELRQNGDVRGALERFKAAHGYGQTPVTGLELGKTHLQVGELVEAREVLLSIARLKVASDETEKSAAARTEAAELAEQIRPRIPMLVVKVSGVKPDAAAHVSVDGANTPVVALTSMRKVNPGEHVVVVQADGREERRSVTLAESETKEMAIELTDASTKTAEDGATERGEPAAVEKRSIHLVTWIGLGVGALGFGLGSIAGIMALGKANAVADACQGLRCPPSARSDVDDGRAVATVSTMGFALGTVGLAAAAVGYFVLSPTKAARVAGVRMTITPAGAGLHGSF